MSRIVQLSEAVSIGLHSMVIIARSKELINVNKISNLTGASRNHLAKIMQRLVKANFLYSNRGPSGGFLLKRKPEDITILSIYEAIEGPVDPTGCPMEQKVCPFSKCLMGSIVKKAEDEIISYFRKQTLKDFI